MLALAATIIGVSYRTGEEVVTDLSRKVLIEIVNRINQAVERHLLGSQIALKAVVPDRIASSPGLNRNVLPFPDDMKQLEDRFWVATGLFPEANRYVYFGGKDGRFIGVNRLPKNKFELRVREPGNGNRRVYSMAGPREPLTLLRTEQYEPRERPWYSSGGMLRKETWSPVYIDFSTHEPLLTLTKPVIDDAQALVGIAATDISLAQLSSFLKSLSISQNGVAFIAERSGALIASSSNELPYKIENKAPVRLMVSESTSPLVRESYANIMQWLKAGENLRSPMAREFHSSAGTVQVAVTSLQDAAGLDWITVVAVPRPDFTASVTNSLYRSLAAVSIVVLIALMLVFIILRLVLRDIRKLSLAAKNIGSGAPFKSLGIDRSDEIGQLAQSFQEMEHHLRIDKLTSLLNRDSLISQIDFRCRNESPAHPLRFSLLFIDLDRFKLINDSYGHDIGDHVLVEVASRLQHTVRAGDSVARFGGDEFVVYLHDVGKEALTEAICEKIRTVLEKPIDVGDDQTDHIGASIGTASYPEDSRDLETLFKIADERMFDQKRMRKSMEDRLAGE